MLTVVSDVKRIMMPYRLARRAAAAALFALSGLAAVPAQAVELVLVEQRGCAYCAMFDRDVAPEYPITAEGRFAPLRRIDLHAPVPDDLSLARRVMFTPTFIVVDATGAELGRLEGYPGEDFFWALLAKMLHETAGFDPDAEAAQ
jgi:alkylhydroperoxidase family enzyme